MAINFNKYAQEGYTFINELAARLGHEGEEAQASILLRAVLHNLRDCITISESFNLISQLPMFMKAIYVDGWKYHEKPERIKKLEQFKDKVKEEQARYGENQFDWEEPTEDLIRGVISCLGKYVSEGEMEDVVSQLPAELKQLFPEEIVNK